MSLRYAYERPSLSTVIIVALSGIIVGLTALTFFTVSTLSNLNTTLLSQNQELINRLDELKTSSTATPETDKVTRAATFIEGMGFKDPIYIGLQQATEGVWPTFTAKAVNGVPVDLMVRTTVNGGWEIQPRGNFYSVESADDFARQADKAVSKWKTHEVDLKNNVNLFGDEASLKFDYDFYKKYDPADSYWTDEPDPTVGWPGK